MNIMKNLYFGIKSDVEDSVFSDVIDKFGSLVKGERYLDDDFQKFNLQPCEEIIYHFAIN